MFSHHVYTCSYRIAHLLSVGGWWRTAKQNNHRAIVSSWSYGRVTSDLVVVGGCNQQTQLILVETIWLRPHKPADWLTGCPTLLTILIVNLFIFNGSSSSVSISLWPMYVDPVVSVIPLQRREFNTVPMSLVAHIWTTTAHHHRVGDQHLLADR